MIKGYLVGVAIFTLGELAMRIAGNLLSPGQRVRMRRFLLITSVLLPLGAWLLPLHELAATLPALTNTEIPFDSAPFGDSARTSEHFAGGHAGMASALQFSWSQLLQLGLLLGFAVAVARLLAAFFSLRRFVGSSRPWPLDWTSGVYVHEAAAIPLSTVVSGRALVLLPAWMQHDLTHAKMAVAHERQHIRNRDPHWAVVFSLAAAALWWHPLRRSWRRRLEFDQELVCDHEVLQSGIPRKDYWETLLSVASRVANAPIPGLALGMVGNTHQSTSNLERRIRAMQQPAKRVTKGTVLGLGTIVVAAQAWIACASMNQPGAMKAQALSLGDLPAQSLALRSLAARMQSSGAKSGRVIVTQTQTGQILAAAGFDGPGNEMDPQRVISEPVRAWSLAKPVLVALALEEGVITETSQFDTTETTVALSGQEFKDYEPLGVLRTGDVIAKSSNIGAVQIARLVGLERTTNALPSFHLSGLGGNTTDVADIAIGKGEVNPLDLLRFYEAIGNGGDLIVEPSTGCGARPIVDHILSEKTSQATLEMLRQVVREGTGRRAASDLQEVGGKTATGSNSAAFVGLMPGLAVWVQLEDGDGLYGGKDAAPVAREIMDQVQTANLLPGC
ncbi:MAG: M56 family metallopeptidase [Myxococcota bacterium]